MEKERKNKNKVIPEICSREYQPCIKTKRLISPTKTLGDDAGSAASWDDRMAEIPDYSIRGRRYVKAFTLIELLVVVLIIGILSAVALPPYRKAVLKSQAIQLWTFARHFRDLCQLDKLAGNNCSGTIQQLGWEYEISDYKVSQSGTETWVSAGYTMQHRNQDYVAYGKIIYFNTSGNSIGCLVYSSASVATQTLGKQICKSLGGEKVSETEYLLSR